MRHTKISEIKYATESKILKHETYIGDLLPGGHLIVETVHALNQVIECVKSIRFPFKKIAANKSQLLKQINATILNFCSFLALAPLNG